MYICGFKLDNNSMPTSIHSQSQTAVFIVHSNRQV